MPLPAEVEVVIYRIIQAALNTIITLAQVSNVSVIINHLSDPIHAVVEALGAGLDMPVLLTISSHRLRLGNVRALAAVLDGTVLIESMPDQETTVFIRTPLSLHYRKS